MLSARARTLHPVPAPGTLADDPETEETALSVLSALAEAMRSGAAEVVETG